MPRKLIKKYMPDEQSLKSNPRLQWLGKHLHNPQLWQLTRRAVSKAFLVGIFCAFLPIPMQMVAAACLALFISSNLPIAVGLVWITNPLTMPPIFYFNYKIGELLLGHSDSSIPMSFSYHYITSELASIWWPLLTGSVVCGTVFALASYAAVNLVWIWQVKSSWRRRHRKQQKK